MTTDAAYLPTMGWIRLQACDLMQNQASDAALLKKYYLGMKQSTGHPPRHANQLGLPCEDFDPSGLRKLAQVHKAPDANVADGLLIRGHARDPRKQLPRMHQQFCGPACLCRIHNGFEGVGLFQTELGH